MAKKNNGLAGLFAAMGAGTTNPNDLAKMAQDAMKDMPGMNTGKSTMKDFDPVDMYGIDGLAKMMGNPDEMIKSLSGILGQMPDVQAMDKKDVKDRTTDDAAVIRNIFKDIPGLNKFVGKLTDEQINAGPQALFDLMEKKKKKAARKARKNGASDETIQNAETAANSAASMFMEMATKMVDEMDKVEKDHGIDTSAAAVNKSAGVKIEITPLTRLVINLIQEMGGNPADYARQLNKIAKDPTSLEKRSAKILKSVTRGNPSFLNTYAYLCSTNFSMSNIGEALKKDKFYQEQSETAQQAQQTHQTQSQSQRPNPMQGWKPGQAAKKIAKIKAKFKSGKRTATETTDALKELTDKAGNNPLALLEILATLSQDLPAGN